MIVEDDWEWDGDSEDVKRLEAENARLETEAVGMRRQLVEQADRIAQLERDGAELLAQRDQADRFAAAYEREIAGVVRKLSKSLEPGADTAGYVQGAIDHLKGLITL